MTVCKTEKRHVDKRDTLHLTSVHHAIQHHVDKRTTTRSPTRTFHLNSTDKHVKTLALRWQTTPKETIIKLWPPYRDGRNAHTLPSKHVDVPHFRKQSHAHHQPSIAISLGYSTRTATLDVLLHITPLMCHHAKTKLTHDLQTRTEAIRNAATKHPVCPT